MILQFFHGLSSCYVTLDAVSVFTFDNVSNVIMLADECSINGTFDAQLLLQRLGVTVQVGMWLSNFVKKYLVILRGINKKR